MSIGTVWGADTWGPDTWGPDTWGDVVEITPTTGVDRRYGVNRYGDEALYGSSDALEALAWDVSIDWDDDGMLETNDADRLIGVRISRGRSRMLATNGAGFEPVPTGTAVLTFRNDDGRYDGWNEDSPLYPNVTYERDGRVRVRDRETGTIYPLFYGRITNITPSGYGVDARVDIELSDGLELLRNGQARVALQEGITPDDAIGKVLDSVGWPSRWGRNLDAASETIYYWWASGNKLAMSEIEDLAQSFLGYFFAAADGKARYIIRTATPSAVENYAQQDLLKDIGNPQPYEIRRNVTRIKVHPRTQAATGTIWELVGTPPSILPGETLLIWANYTYDGDPTPAVDVITPVATTDILINTAADGGGSDITASCTIQLTDFGDTALLKITNNSASTGYPYFCRIRGDAIYEPNVSDVTYPSDISSVTNARELLFDLIWQQDVNVAVDLSNVLGPFFASLHPIPTVKMKDQPGMQFTADLFDVATADLDILGLIGISYRVGGIDHRTLQDNCQSVETAITLEPYVSSEDFMRWDTASEWDSTTVFGW